MLFRSDKQNEGQVGAACQNLQREEVASSLIIIHFFFLSEIQANSLQLSYSHYSSCPEFCQFLFLKMNRTTLTLSIFSTSLGTDFMMSIEAQSGHAFSQLDQ